MRVTEILEQINGTVVTKNTKDTEFDGVYAGDLLSHVMAHAKENNLFLTIMANINAIAVASLLDLPVVVFAEGVNPTEEMITKADEEQIVIITTELNVVDVIRRIYSL